MAELGVGTRVWIGWEPDHMVAARFDPRCKSGTIKSGPFLPGELVHCSYVRKTFCLSKTYWAVDVDNGDTLTIAERVLFPIDDGDPVTTEETDLAEA